MAGALPSCMKRGGTVSLRMIPHIQKQQKNRLIPPPKAGGISLKCYTNPGSGYKVLRIHPF